MIKVASGSTKIGEYIIFLAKLQLFWFGIVFRYFIVGGIFPATAAVIDFLFQSFNPKERKKDFNYKAFKQSAQENFKRANQVGYISILALIILGLDLRIAIVFLKNVYLNVCLATLLVIFVGTFLYLIPAIVRYELSLKDAFRQAFFLLLANILNTIAMILGMAIALLISFYIPVLVLVPVPVFLLSNAWFSYQAMLKIEKRNEKA